MTMNKNEAVFLLQLVLKVLDEMTQSEYEQLISGTGKLRFTSTSNSQEIHQTKRSSSMLDKELWALAERLQSSKSRDEARELLHLDSRAVLRDNLAQLARLLRVHVNKHDKRDAIEDKIIEFVVGVRLRSEAIHGLSLKGSGTERSDVK